MTSLIIALLALVAIAQVMKAPEVKPRPVPVTVKRLRRRRK
ncbi:hypothetical protein LNTAR_01532 [Lentisphaera araneosa HTCC2155]|uniref:Uncharacterized protein n=1 Tax=Lentisphaera araneosa HTCC2155 TaxID=313628 RepID=A6DRA0_9BACT|nr:hypothetical protein [Lentisphaera araneosa]EDM25847.1 hypothetical protein LNTAR_01532 [Lentisphaera araneosa HTCC2155]